MALHLLPLTDLAVAALNAGDLPRAELLSQQARNLDPNDSEPIRILGCIAFARGEDERAINLLESARRLNPNGFATYFDLARVYAKLHRLDDAIAAARISARLAPQHVVVLDKLGTLLLDAHRAVEAVEVFEAALQVEPTREYSLHSLGVALMKLGRWDDAIVPLEKLQGLGGRSPYFFSDLGVAYAHQGEYDKADRSFGLALEMQPNHVPALASKALVSLVQGRYRQGFAEYEYRLSEDLPIAKTPAWKGEMRPGLRLLLIGEQGFGDSIQFCRYIPQLVAAGIDVTLFVNKPLAGLMKTLPVAVGILTPNDPVPACDAYLHLLSFPAVLDPDLAHIPTAIPYLSAEPAKVAHWAKRLETAQRKIGLVWAGLPDNLRDSARSTSLEAFRPLLSLPNTRFVSLQKGPPAEQIEKFPQIFNAGPELVDFSDTAALVANLDLLITVDTSVLHLAGALGKPVYALIAKVPDWRWGLEGTESRWYPTLRLFRQSVRGDYQTPIAQIRGVLTGN